MLVFPMFIPKLYGVHSRGVPSLYTVLLTSKFPVFSTERANLTAESLSATFILTSPMTSTVEPLLSPIFPLFFICIRLEDTEVTSMLRNLLPVFIIVASSDIWNRPFMNADCTSRPANTLSKRIMINGRALRRQRFWSKHMFHPLLVVSHQLDCRPLKVPGALTFHSGQCLSLIHISEPTRLGMISYAVFCLKK